MVCEIILEDKDKYRFLASLQTEFNTWREKGFTKTHLIKGNCNGCHTGHKAYQFYTNKVTHAFAYIIHEEQNEIHDIFMCNSSDGMTTVDLKKIRKFDFWKAKSL